MDPPAQLDTNTWPSIYVSLFCSADPTKKRAALLLVFFGFGVFFASFCLVLWMCVGPLRREAEGGGDGRQLGVLGGEGGAELSNGLFGGRQLGAERLGRLLVAGVLLSF